VTSFRVVLALVLVMVVVLLAVGCAGQKAGVIPANSARYSKRNRVILDYDRPDKRQTGGFKLLNHW
jgi:hypothetical protein